MEIQSSKLDTLPVEILRHIISLGSCEAVCILLKVNRSLYRACADHLVVKL